MNNLYKILGVFAVFILLFSGCENDSIDPHYPKPDDYDYTVPLAWNNLFLDVERYTPGYRPPVSARTAGYIGLTAYESVVWATLNNRSFSGYYPGLTLPKPELANEYDWEAVLNSAYEAAFYYYFPTSPASQQFKIRDLAESFHREFEKRNSQEVYNRSVEYGYDVARVIYEWSKTDHAGHEGYLKNVDPTYTPPQGHGKWQPTYPDYSRALLPRWGQVRTFAALATDKVAPPYEVSDEPGSEIYNEAKEVLDLVNLIKSGQNHEDKWIAEFWSDDCPILTFTPAGRWIAVTNQVVEEERADLSTAVVAYAKVSMAIADAGIRCWGEKYSYNLERPIDYIRRVIPGAGNWNTLMCPDGSGNYYTPPFPAYPSGHATFGAAAATVLTDIFGTNYSLEDHCHVGRTEFLSTPRKFDAFHDMASENAYSRIPIGVHFRIDAEAGIELGNIVGQRVNDLPWTY